MYFRRPEKRPDQKNAGAVRSRLLRLAVVVCLLIGGVSCLVRGAIPILNHWPYSYSESVRAQVIDSRFERGAGWRGLFRSQPVFSYRYLFRGELFLGSSYRPAGKRAEAVRRYAPGIVIDVFVDPDHPTRAMVQPGVTGGELVAPVLGMGLLFLGFALVLRRLW